MDWPGWRTVPWPNKRPQCYRACGLWRRPLTVAPSSADVVFPVTGAMIEVSNHCRRHCYRALIAFRLQHRSDQFPHSDIKKGFPQVLENTRPPCALAACPRHLCNQPAIATETESWHTRNTGTWHRIATCAHKLSPGLNRALFIGPLHVNEPIVAVLWFVVFLHSLAVPGLCRFLRVTHVHLPNDF